MTLQMILLFSLFGIGSKVQKPVENLYEIKINDINGKPMDLSQYKGKYILFVNVASECGFTKQYEELQQLYEDHKDNLVIIGSPCNQFGGQEPGTAEEIQQFCKMNFGVTFPLTEKIEVKGENQHPLYAWLTDKDKNGSKSSSIKWNFQKYLVSPDGELIDYYYSITTPTSSKITKHLSE